VKFYAYIPDKQNNEPLGTFNRALFELKTVKGAIKKCKNNFKTDNFRLFSYTNFYDDKTFRDIY
jgi:hypothetical protein